MVPFAQVPFGYLLLSHSHVNGGLIKFLAPDDQLQLFPFGGTCMFLEPDLMF